MDTCVEQKGVFHYPECLFLFPPVIIWESKPDMCEIWRRMERGRERERKRASHGLYGRYVWKREAGFWMVLCHLYKERRTSWAKGPWGGTGGRYAEWWSSNYQIWQKKCKKGLLHIPHRNRRKNPPPSPANFPPFAHLPKSPESLKFPHSPPSPRILFLFDFLGKGKGTSSAWLKDGEGFGLQTRYYCITHPPPTSLRAVLTIQARERKKRRCGKEGSLSFILQMSKALNFSTFDLGEPFLLSITSSIQASSPCLFLIPWNTFFAQVSLVEEVI